MGRRLFLFRIDRNAFRYRRRDARALPLRSSKSFEAVLCVLNDADAELETEKGSPG